MITLATLPQATAQQVFDQVARHLIRQDSKSLSNSQCVYRDSDGRKCAAGCLISDQEYEARMEGKNWNSLHHHDYVPDEHFDLIFDLQNIHDNYPVKEWIQQLRVVADRYLLQAEVLSEKRGTEEAEQ